jgi:D-alanyl-lipoteichoic acid acyltransferase DltB (MBOAT superfamily)
MLGPIFFNTFFAAAIACFYIILGTCILRLITSEFWRHAGFAILNLSCVFFAFFVPDWSNPLDFDPRQIALLVVYIALASLHHNLLAAFSQKRTRLLYVTALWSPVILLFAIKLQSVFQLIGVSYMAFRMSNAAMEMHRDPEFKVGLVSYMGFLFFLPTMSLGPISPLKLHMRGFQAEHVPGIVVARGLGRILVGYVMFKLLAPVAQQLDYSNLLDDGFKHNAFGFLLASYANLAFLFFNFSGACHMAIGVAAILGFPVKENFDNPVLSRSVKDFWNRWHISLSEFVRDLVFTPLSLTLTRALGPAWSLTATLIAAMATFTVVGLWHGMSKGFLIFGLLHGLGFCFNIIFEDMLRSRKLNRHWLFKTRMWRLFSIILTLTFIAATTIFMTRLNPFE